jgi:asparagine synthase (glutamine-hydrolysing)
MLTTGFTLVAGPTLVEFEPYGELPEIAARLLSFAQDDSISVMLMGRLCYREEQLLRLRGRLEERTFDRCGRSDAALAQAIYRVGGIESLCRLEGDFVLACYDKATNRMLALRDPMGAYPLFWMQHGNITALSTSIRPLVDLLHYAELDCEYMADYLAFPMDAISEIPAARTAYRGVWRLLPGHVFEAGLSTRQVVCRRYWNWQETTNQVAVATVEAAGELVRERLEAAIRERLSCQAQNASHFSGGFDSTGVALLASLLTQNQSKPLHALSLVYEQDPMLAQEQQYIQYALKQRSQIIYHPIPADGLLDFDDYERIPPLDEPWPMGARLKVVEELVRTGHDAGADTIMTGDGADHLFAQSCDYLLAEHLSKGRVRQAWRLARQWGYDTSQSPWHLYFDALKLVVPLRVRDGMGPLLKGGRTAFEELTARTIPPWFTDEFVRRFQVRKRILDWQYPPVCTGVMTAEAVAFSAGDCNNWYVGLPKGVVICRPYWDARLVTLGLALPRSLLTRPGQMKPVLAAALKDVLPEQVVTRSRKVHFGELNSGLARNRRSLEEMILQAPISEGVLDRSMLIESLEKAGLGIYREAISVGRLRLALSYAIWISGREAWLKRTVPRNVCARSLNSQYSVQRPDAQTTCAAPAEQG